MSARMLAQACGLALMVSFAAQAATPDARAVAATVLDQLDAGHYDAAAAPFTDDMQLISAGPNATASVSRVYPPTRSVQQQYAALHTSASMSTLNTA